MNLNIDALITQHKLEENLIAEKQLIAFNYFLEFKVF